MNYCIQHGDFAKEGLNNVTSAMSVCSWIKLTTNQPVYGIKRTNHRWVFNAVWRLQEAFHQIWFKQVVAILPNISETTSK